MKNKVNKDSLVEVFLNLWWTVPQPGTPEPG